MKKSTFIFILFLFQNINLFLPIGSTLSENNNFIIPFIEGDDKQENNLQESQESLSEESYSQNNSSENINENKIAQEEEIKNPPVEEFSKIHRIVSFSPLAVSTLIALEKSVSKLIGITPEIQNLAKNSFISDEYSEFFKITTTILSSKEYPHIESLKSLNADLIIYNTKGSEVLVKALKQNFDPSLLFEFSYETEKEFIDTILKLASIIGKKNRAEMLIQYRQDIAKKIFEITKQIPNYKRPKILFLDNIILEYQLSAWDKSTEYWINLVGGRLNPSTQSAVYIEKSLIEKLNPDYIFLTPGKNNGYPDHIYQSKDLDRIIATKKFQIYKIPINFDSWMETSLQNPLMWILISKLLHPELFKDLRFLEEIKSFFKNTYNIELKIKPILKMLSFKENQISNFFIQIVKDT